MMYRIVILLWPRGQVRTAIASREMTAGDPRFRHAGANVSRIFDPEAQWRKTRSPGGFQLRAPQVQSRVAGDVLKVCIGAEQFCAEVETRLRDDTVHSSTHSDPFASQRAV